MEIESIVLRQCLRTEVFRPDMNAEAMRSWLERIEHAISRA